MRGKLEKCILEIIKRHLKDSWHFCKGSRSYEWSSMIRSIFKNGTGWGKQIVER